MIRKKEDLSIEYREHMREGDGTVELIAVIVYK